MTQIQHTTSECGFAAMRALSAQMHAPIRAQIPARARAMCLASMRVASMHSAAIGARAQTTTAQAHACVQERILRSFLPL